MKRAIFVVVGVLWIAGAVWAWQQNAQMIQASRSLPETVVIKRTMPDTALVCAEPADGGLVACRSVKDFRMWAQERGK